MGEPYQTRHHGARQYTVADDCHKFLGEAHQSGERVGKKGEVKRAEGDHAPRPRIGGPEDGFVYEFVV